MKAAFWNTRPTDPIFLGVHEITMRGVGSATIPLPDRDELSGMVVATELHHILSDISAENYSEERRYARIDKVKIDRKHGEPKLRFYLKV